MATVARLASTGCVLVLAGCGATEAPGPSVTPWGFGPALESLAEQATAAGASEQQQQVLARWSEIHDTPFADVADSAQRLFDCFDAAGVAYVYSAPAGGDDYPEFHYLVAEDPDRDDDSELAVINRCEDLEINFVSLAYQTGPGITARRARDDAAFFPQALQCLEREGVTIGSDITTLAELDAYLTDEGLGEHAACTAPPYTNVD